MTGTPQGGVISPLLSNIYLHVLDRVWEDRCAHLGTLVRYADDFVVMCDTKPQVEEARRRVGTVLTRLGLELHPEKTRMVDLSRGREGFDFLGCHLRKRMSGPVWERTRRRVYYLQRWPSQRAMTRMRARVRDADRSRAVSRGCPPHHRGPQSGAPWLGSVLSHGQCGDEIHPDRPIRRGAAATPARQTSRARGSAPGVRPSGAAPSSKPWDSVACAARFSIRGLRNAAT